MMKADAMPVVKICPLPANSLGPLGGPFTVESVEGTASIEGVKLESESVGDADAGPQDNVAATVVQFARWISRGMTYYQNKGGIEDSSLFKSFAVECFEELARDAPEAAGHLSGLIVMCNGLPSSVTDDPIWRLHRAILATLPGVRFVE
jgi:hypothetical protein